MLKWISPPVHPSEACDMFLVSRFSLTPNRSRRFYCGLRRKLLFLFFLGIFSFILQINFLVHTPVNISMVTTRSNTSPLPRAHVTHLEVFYERQQRLVAACADQRKHIHDHMPVNAPRKLFRVGDLAMCPIPKSGSTFWKQVLLYIHDNKTDPFFEADYGDVHKRAFRLEKTASDVIDDDTITAVFVREPYTRLFSGYMDKIFQPRLDNWRRFARPMADFLLTDIQARDTVHYMCPANISFAQFVSYFIAAENAVNDTGLPRNPHFVPQSFLCGFCSDAVKPAAMQARRQWLIRKLLHARDRKLAIPSGNRLNTSSDTNLKPRDIEKSDMASRVQSLYDFIGKAESLLDDAAAILKAGQLAGRLPSFEDADRRTKRQLIRLTLHRLWNTHLVNVLAHECQHKEEALRRVWKSLQVRGIISKRELFPVLAGDIVAIKGPAFVNITLAAFQRSARDPTLRRNTKEAMLEAYSTVPYADRTALQKIFDTDFRLFGYPSSIPEVFPEKDVFVLGDYSYFDLFDRTNKEGP